MVGLVDIDNFKVLNDTHGHLVGDTLLVEAIRRISSCTRDSDSVGRYGGDEFLVVYSPCDDTAVETVLERLVRTVCMPEIDVDGTSVQMTISVGAAVAKSSEPAESRDILEAADRALYSAKATGGNAWSISKE
jgi:diguanylate cyclase (GGDEF)-like protein